MIKARASTRNYNGPLIRYFVCARIKQWAHLSPMLTGGLSDSRGGSHSKKNEKHDDVINGIVFPVIGPLCGGFTGHRWISLTKVQWRAELWCFLWSVPEQTVEQTPRRRWLETPSHLLWRHFSDVTGLWKVRTCETNYHPQILLIDDEASIIFFRVC